MRNKHEQVSGSQEEKNGRIFSFFCNILWTKTLQASKVVPE